MARVGWPIGEVGQLPPFFNQIKGVAISALQQLLHVKFTRHITYKPCDWNDVAHVGWPVGGVGRLAPSYL